MGNLLSTVTLDDTYRYDTLTISGSGDSSSASVVNVDHVILRTDFSGLSNNQYLAFTVSIDSATNNGVFDVRRYDDICASSTPSIISECSGLSDGESCTFIYDPCLSDIYGLDNNVYIFELESPGGNYTYTFDVEVRSISFIDTSATRLTPGGVMSYSADKEISENTWHFYQFTVTENDGYSTLDFAISTSCIQSGDALEIYATFVYTDGTDTHLEIVTPKRFPTADCNAQSSTASTTFSEFFDTCKMVAGTYQIGIYAPEDIDLVDETTFPTVTRSVQYTISAALETADYVLAVPGCPLTLTGDFTRRIELRMDAVPALSRVIFGLTDNDDDDSISDFTLRYGLTAPEGTADECTLDDSIIIPDSGSNSVVISACDLEVETIYFYVVGDFDDSDDSITFFSEIEYNYPVQLPSGADFVHSAVLPSRSTFVQADVPASELTTALTRYTQYYRYELASATTVSFTNAACSSCSFDVEIIDPDFNCPTTACASGVCNVSPCDYSSDYIYFAVTRNDAIPTDAATDANCTITVESVALFSSLTNARTLVDEVTQCEPVACEQLYQISGSDATRRISTETVTIDTDVDLTIYIGDDLSCPTVDSCTAGNTCTYTVGGDSVSASISSSARVNSGARKIITNVNGKIDIGIDGDNLGGNTTSSIRTRDLIQLFASNRFALSNFIDQSASIGQRAEQSDRLHSNGTVSISSRISGNRIVTSYGKVNVIAAVVAGGNVADTRGTSGGRAVEITVEVRINNLNVKAARRAGSIGERHCGGGSQLVAIVLSVTSQSGSELTSGNIGLHERASGRKNSGMNKISTRRQLNGVVVLNFTEEGDRIIRIIKVSNNIEVNSLNFEITSGDHNTVGTAIRNDDAVVESALVSSTFRSGKTITKGEIGNGIIVIIISKTENDTGKSRDSIHSQLDAASEITSQGQRTTRNSQNVVSSFKGSTDGVLNGASDGGESSLIDQINIFRSINSNLIGTSNHLTSIEELGEGSGSSAGLSIAIRSRETLGGNNFEMGVSSISVNEGGINLESVAALDTRSRNGKVQGAVTIILGNSELIEMPGVLTNLLISRVGHNTTRSQTSGRSIDERNRANLNIECRC